MCHHTHLTLEEREDIMCLRLRGESISAIAREIGRNKSTVSREIARNSDPFVYRASKAQWLYERRRKACRRRSVLDDRALLSAIAEKIINYQWSPEQIQGRFELEGVFKISFSTIYRGIRTGRFDEFVGGRKAHRRLRRKGKRRRGGDEERRGRFHDANSIDDRPEEAERRERLGDWEADTVAGKRGGACLVTLVDRRSRLLVGGKAKDCSSRQVCRVMKRALSSQPCKTITPDRGKEFARHEMVTKACGAEFFFAHPSSPWQRGTNENTNGLLREYFPKGKSMDDVSEKEISDVFDKLNKRPRKQLGYLSPYEVHYSELLRLV